MHRLAIAVLVGAAGLLAAAQLFLPSLAQRRLADDLAGYGDRPAVDVDAVPAIKLLWGDADRVEVRMDRARLSPGLIARELRRAGGAGEIDVRVGELQIGPVTLRDVELRREGGLLRGAADLAPGELRGALPGFVDLVPAPGALGEGVAFDGAITLLGARVAGRAHLLARDGRLVFEPDLPFGDLASLTVFADERVRVRDVAATPGPGGLRLSATADLL